MTERTLFISHASEDTPVVRRIVDYLEAQGVTCWIAGRDIPPRAVYAEAITEAVKNSQACGVIVSRAANASAAIKRELELASRYERPFIPIRIDDTEPGPGLDYYLNNIQWTEFKRDGNEALDRIVSHMRGQTYTAPPQRTKRSVLAGVLMFSALVLSIAAAGGWYFLRNTQGGDATTLETAATAVQPDEAIEGIAAPPSATPTVASPPPNPPTDPAAPALRSLDRISERTWLVETNVVTNYLQDVPAASLQAAAERGDRRARYALGVFYGNGYGGLTLDGARSQQYLEMSANQGFAPAEGWMVFYYEGAGPGPFDEQLAMQWQDRAIQHGYAPSQYARGQRLCAGEGFPRDLEQGRRLSNLALQRGFVPPPGYVHQACD